MSKNVKITHLTANVRENFAQKMSQESRIFIFETGQINPFQRTRARLEAACTNACNNFFVQNREKLPLRRGLKCHLSNSFIPRNSIILVFEPEFGDVVPWAEDPVLDRRRSERVEVMRRRLSFPPVAPEGFQNEGDATPHLPPLAGERIEEYSE